jgi:ribosomal protein S18 acetylase RimI-like enzyme
MNDAETNLWEFYSTVGRTCKSTCRTYTSWSYVSASAGCWPSVVYNLNRDHDREQHLQQLSGAIVHEGIPDMFIARAEHFGPEQQPLLRRYGFYPVDKWTLMEWTPESPFPAVRDTGNGSICRLTHSSELRQFSEIVNSVLFRNQPADALLLKALAESEVFSFWGFKEENEVVSGLLTFTHDLLTGLYMVATKREKQKQGIGSAIVSGILHEMETSGSNKIVLQSSVSAVSFYKRIGFTVTGEMYIYKYFSPNG